MTGLIELPRHEAPARLQDQHGEGCAVCLRKVDATRAWYVHIVQSSMIAPVDSTEEYGDADGGWLPVGPECAKHIPAAYRERI